MMARNKATRHSSIRPHLAIVFSGILLASFPFWPSSTAGSECRMEADLSSRHFVDMDDLLFGEPDWLSRMNSEKKGDDDAKFALTLDRIAIQISQGIVYSTNAEGSVAGFGDAIVDLPVLVANSVDREFSNADAYWQYYSNCDRWNVVFNDPYQDTNPDRDACDLNHGKSRLTPSPRRTVIDQIRESYLALEFAIVEGLPTGRLNTSITDNDTCRPSSLFAIGQQLVQFGYGSDLLTWTKLRNQIERHQSRYQLMARNVSSLMNWFEEHVSVKGRIAR